MKKLHVVLDIDNCIANDAHRIELIDWDSLDPDDRYTDYHAAAWLDKPSNSHLYHGSVLDLRADLILITARPERFRAMTVQWLEHNFSFLPWLLIMRPHGDHSPSAQLKPRLLKALGPAGVTQNTVLTCYDDHEGVVKEYRAAGYVAEGLKIHDVDAYNRPETKR